MVINNTTTPCNFSLMACFADIKVSQGSVATCGRRDGTYNIYLTADLPSNLPVIFLNRLRFDRIMVMSLWPRFFGPPCIFSLALPAHFIMSLCITVYYCKLYLISKQKTNIDRQQQRRPSGLLLRSGAGPQHISIDSCCCCGPRKFGIELDRIADGLDHGLTKTDGV